MHFDSLRVSREWWYFTAVFNGSQASLANGLRRLRSRILRPGISWGPRSLISSSSACLTRPVCSTVVWSTSRITSVILKSGTLVASTPGVKLSYDSSWVEGTAPFWHVHAEDAEIDTAHTVVIDLDYHAQSLPLWTLGTKAFVVSNSTLASYVFLDCEISGTVSIDGVVHQVSGVGTYEHTWSPRAVTRAEINGWDWFSIQLDNGWMVYASNYLPTPQALTQKVTALPSFGTVVITTDHGETCTELKNLNVKVTTQDEKVFPLGEDAVRVRSGGVAEPQSDVSGESVAASRYGSVVVCERICCEFH